LQKNVSLSFTAAGKTLIQIKGNEGRPGLDF